jgi:hypothetical protein
LFSITFDDRIEVWVQKGAIVAKLFEIVPPIYRWSASASVTDVHPNQDSTKFIGDWERLSPGHFLSTFSVPVARILYRASISGTFRPDYGRRVFRAASDSFVQGSVAGSDLKGFGFIGDGASQPRNPPESFPIPPTELNHQSTGEASPSTSELNLRSEASAVAGRSWDQELSSITSLNVEGTIEAEFFPDFSLKSSYLSVSQQALYCWVQWGIEGGKQGTYVIANRFNLAPSSVQKFTETLDDPDPEEKDPKHFLASFDPPIPPEDACIAQFTAEPGINFPVNQMTSFDLQQDIDGIPFGQAIFLSNTAAQFDRFNIGVQDQTCELPPPIPGKVLAPQIDPEDFQANSEQIEILAAAVI